MIILNITNNEKTLTFKVNIDNNLHNKSKLLELIKKYESKVKENTWEETVEKIMERISNKIECRIKKITPVNVVLEQKSTR